MTELPAAPPFVPSAAPVAPDQPVATAAPKRPSENAQQAASTRSQVSQHPPESGLLIGPALIAAGAALPVGKLTEAQCLGTSYDQRMMEHYGVKARDWLLSQGWRLGEKQGEKRKWFPTNK